jgi:anti-sigma factor RsiW
MSEVPKNHRRQDILLYEQNLLDEDERKELEEHLRGCAECQATQVTVKRFLPMLHEALKPNELPAEELLRRVKAQMRAKAEAPAPFFTRVRVAVVGFGLAAASTAFIVVQTLLQPVGPAMVVHSGTDAGAGVVSSPRRPEREENEDAGVDGGMDAGSPHPDPLPGGERELP